MTSSTLSRVTSVPTGWTVHVDVEIRGAPGRPDPADDLALAFAARTGPGAMAVLLLDDLVRVTWSAPSGGDVRDAGHALVRGLDLTLELVSRHAVVTRVRHARVESCRSLSLGG